MIKEVIFNSKRGNILENPKPQLEDILIENIQKPKIAEIDGQKFEQHSLRDQMEAIKFYSSVKTSKSRHCGLKFFKMRNGGAE